MVGTEVGSGCVVVMGTEVAGMVVTTVGGWVAVVVGAEVVTVGTAVGTWVAGGEVAAVV